MALDESWNKIIYIRELFVSWCKITPRGQLFWNVLLLFFFKKNKKYWKMSSLNSLPNKTKQIHFKIRHKTYPWNLIEVFWIGRLNVLTMRKVIPSFILSSIDFLNKVGLQSMLNCSVSKLWFWVFGTWDASCSCPVFLSDLMCCLVQWYNGQLNMRAWHHWIVCVCVCVEAKCVVGSSGWCTSLQLPQLIMRLAEPAPAIEIRIMHQLDHFHGNLHCSVCLLF